MTDFNRNYSMTIHGRAVDHVGTFAAFNPATGDAIARVPDATRAQLDSAVESAQRAFSTWRSTTREQRAKALSGIATAIENNAEAFIALLTREQGKPRAGAEWEILGSVFWLRKLPSRPCPRRSWRTRLIVV